MRSGLKICPLKPQWKVSFTKGQHLCSASLPQGFSLQFSQIQPDFTNDFASWIVHLLAGLIFTENIVPSHEFWLYQMGTDFSPTLGSLGHPICCVYDQGFIGRVESNCRGGPALAPHCSVERSGQSPGKSWHDACWGGLPYSLTDLYSFIFMCLLITLPYFSYIPFIGFYSFTTAIKQAGETPAAASLM